MFDGQFYPFQPIQFMDGLLNPIIGSGAVADIEITDDGDFALSSGGTTATHTFNSVVTSRADSFALITWNDDQTITLDTATWGGNACSILVQATTTAATRRGCAIIHRAGTQTGNIVLTFSAACTSSHVTAVSLDNLQSSTPVDTDSDVRASGDATSNDLDALAAPGVGGIRLAVQSNSSDTTALTWTNATEVSDLDAGSNRHTAAYDLGNNSSTINTSQSSNSFAIRAICGVSMR